MEGGGGENPGSKLLVSWCGEGWGGGGSITLLCEKQEPGSVEAQDSGTMRR